MAGLSDVPTMPMLLAGFIVFFALQRVAELVYANRTARTLAAQGAIPIRPDGYTLLVLVHAAWFLGLVLEGSLASYRTTRWLPIGLAMVAVGEFLRYWSMWALGWRWNTRVWVLKAAPLVTRGPYRFLPHPIYIGVVLELAGLPLAFGLWGTLVVVGLLNAAGLALRIRIESRAIRGPA